MATKIELQEEIKRLNHEYKLDFAVSDEYNELQKTLREAKAKVAGLNSGDDKKSVAKVSATNAVYVWLKNPAYADKDGVKRIAGGFYKLDLAEYPRLKSLPKNTCEIFTDVPTRKLVEIAKWFGINTEKHNDDELLDLLETKPALY